ncbi:MAG TPA: glycoside hydrolase family 2 TIM barrel-domain containing protein [Saprospiraceae bacterium]|nr:glycoside hydrolase family 2 TIM barrel-domain containing protein [Saprospiraceae bacterium]
MKFNFLKTLGKPILFIVCLFFCTLSTAQWAAKGDHIKTIWGEKINAHNVLSEYPRPIMERKDWMNLNGLWDFAITEADEPKPIHFNEKILVPFPIESSLSGIMRSVGKGKEAWYQTKVNIPANWMEKNILLHFGAVDWKADIWINDIKVGSHSGGYSSFSIDITPFLKADSQIITVKVWDPTDDGPQPRGKQVNKPGGIWYTPVSGIWQTVWLEPVNSSAIASIKTTPDIDRNSIGMKAKVNNAEYGDIIKTLVFDDGNMIKSEMASVNESVEITLHNPKLWSPESPFLYTAKIQLIRKGNVIDEVDSYFAMRKISAKRDAYGIIRMQLNNQDYFHYGTLDQGWWPDGLYTAPSDEALLFDIQKTKDFGFNMIRKHVKVEPERWYYHCDKIGMLVWQDMPNGDKIEGWQMRKMFDGSEIQRSPESEEIFRREWKEIIDQLYSYPSIVVWVPFNEAWGQFKTVEISEWTKKYDPTRLVNSASGGNHIKTGDILDIHNYPDPGMYLFDADRVNVLGEYGGIGLPLKGHLWQSDKNWGYIQFKNEEEVTHEYIKYTEILKRYVKSGFSAAVYTQTTDVEGEVNGLMTYDRKRIKLIEDKVRVANKSVIDVLPRNDH